MEEEEGEEVEAQEEEDEAEVQVDGNPLSCDSSGLIEELVSMNQKSFILKMFQKQIQNRK